MKMCTRCKQEKPETAFTVQKNRPDGLSIYCRACWREYRQEKDNNEYQREYQKTYRETHRENHKGYRERRKGRMFSIPMLKEKQTDERGVIRCAYCGKNLAATGFHVDHIIPLARGGTNEQSNLALACPSCNLSKGRMTLEEWRDIRSNK